MIRDSIKSLTYYEEYLEYEYNRIEKFENAIKEVIAVRGEDEAVQATYSSVQSFYFNVIAALYSSGALLDEIRNFFPKVINIMKKAWDPNDGYVEMLWMISIGIMLDVPKEQMVQLEALLKKGKLEDYLINYLIHSYNKEWPCQTNDFLFDQPYSLFSSIIKAKDKVQAVDLLEKYLKESWYEGHDDMGWYDSHKNMEDTYNGYWSFESGAVLKILGLDDSSLKDVEYYPYDMVHYQES